MRGLALVFISLSAVFANKNGVHYKVHCEPDLMRVELLKREGVSNVYLQHLKDFPDPSCKPSIEGRRVTFSLKLTDIYQCMITKIVNKQTDSKVYYHRVIVEYDNNTPKESILVKCRSDLTPLGNSTYDSEVEAVSLVKRQADFPVNFQESDVEITSEVTGVAPEPYLNIGVRQDGILIDDELNVKPGTPLNMEIYLDNDSKDVYGVLVSGMEVTDTRSQTEPILVNGCSVDPYLFENFASVDGDFLKAKFRAFKFPESNYVLFKGTVNVCLDTCKGVQCSNGQLGFGRRRRDISAISPDPNKVYEISTSTVIRLECEDCPVFKKKPDSKINILSAETAEVKSFKANEEAALSALFEEFREYRTPGVAVFEKNGSSCLSSATTLLLLAAAVINRTL